MAPSDTLFYRMLYPRLTCLVTTSHEDKSNVNVVDWAMPVAIKPPMLAISINKRGMTADLISGSKEFALAIPPETMRDVVANCAKTSGKFIDKFSEFGIPTMKAKVVKAPLIANAIGQMECKVTQIMDCGEHEIVVGEVVEAYFPDEDKSAPAPLFNRGSRGYFGFPRDAGEDDRKDSRKGDDKSSAPRSGEGKIDDRASRADERMRSEEKKADERQARSDEKKAEDKKADEKKAEEKKAEDKKSG